MNLSTYRKRFLAYIYWRPQQIFCGAVLLALAAYVSLKEIHEVPPYEYVKDFVHMENWKLFKGTAVVVILYSTFVQITSFVLQFFPACVSKAQEPERIAECLLTINKEIEQHLHEIVHNPQGAHTTFIKSHNFSVNVGLVVASLGNHLLRAFPLAEKKDIFVSLYQVDPAEPDEEVLTYMCHWRPQRDVVNSKTIDLNKTKYKGYECVKAIKDQKSTVVLFDCTDFKTTGKSRGKTKHYVGLHIELAGKTLGFLNIEFHNRQFFNDSEELTNFVENELVSFKYLVEYQFLKRKFFHVVKTELIGGTV